MWLFELYMYIYYKHIQTLYNIQHTKQIIITNSSIVSRRAERPTHISLHDSVYQSKKHKSPQAKEHEKHERTYWDFYWQTNNKTKKNITTEWSNN